MTIDERIAAELRRHAPQVDEPEAWDRIQSALPARRRGKTLRLVSVSVAAFGFVLLGFVLLPNLSSGPPPASDPQTPFLGTWVNTDADGSTQTATFEVSIVGVVEMVVVDDYASVCSGVPSTMTGTGRLEGTTTMIVPSPVLTCDDGSEPQAPSGPPLEEQLQNLTFTLDAESDTLIDNLGLAWNREGAEDPRPEPTVQDSMWPQSSLEEVREAQELADAADPDFTWQLEPALEENLNNGDYLGDPEIFARFLREELGWEEFSRVVGAEYGDRTIGVTYIRCAVGESNSIYPDDLRVGRCAPTIDELSYEAVTISVVQPGQRGPSGIWVIDGWAMVEPVEQVVPPTTAEATAIVEAFLQARIDGRGAEQYFGGGDGGAPLLYATSAGAIYERFEFALTDAPSWPSGEMNFDVRLFAENGQTVVEQTFMLERDESGRWGLETWPDTIENGRSLPQFYEFLDGEVSYSAAPPWDYSWAGWEFSPTMSTLLLDADIKERLVVLADPQPIETACIKGEAPATAEALARGLGSDPDLETTEPVAVRMAGIDALQMDVTAVTSRNLCPEVGVPEVVAGGTATSLDPGQRMRLYLIDYPGKAARVLAIAIIAPEDRFEQVLGAATPIVDSFDFPTG